MTLRAAVAVTCRALERAVPKIDVKVRDADDIAEIMECQWLDD